MIYLIVNASLADPDPIGYIQDKLTYYTRQYYAAKVITYMAKYYRFDTFTATAYLRNVLSGKYMS
jgi:hypothetical protein